MNVANLTHMTSCGLPGIDSVPFGTHACHFYKDRDELIAALVPYFVAGLRANERCLWITASPLPAGEALDELRAAWPDADSAIDAGKLRIIDFDAWYNRIGQMKGPDVVQLWLEEEERAIEDGFNGLRVTGNISFLTPDTWSPFMDYEKAVSTRFKNRRIVALCSYLVTQCENGELSEVMHAHNCALERDDTTWRVVPRTGFPLNKAYRCYFTNEHDRIQTFDIVEAVNDSEAAVRAQELVASSKHTSAEVWHGKRLIGRWVNGDFRKP
jgi:two-component system, sensor histidine kinase PdtaS